jgi:maltose alpha-D-glucosyltransferase/alpha-amylase
MEKNKHWYQEAVFYELNIRAYKDSNGDGIGDFRGAIQKLDYIKSLGVDCIWIMPMYPSPLKDDGYDVADYTSIHPDYGNLDDFQAFLEAAHERGLRVITDLVMNHTSADHPWFQAARRDRHSPYRDYYVWSDTPDKYQEARIIFLDTESSNWTYDELAGQYFWHRFYSHQPDLNYDNPAVHEEMFEVVRFWMDRGIDGFRLDAVPYLYEREGTNCENLPETHAFLKKVRHLIDEEYPHAVLIAEANQWPEDLIPYFGDGDEFHICFHFPSCRVCTRPSNRATRNQLSLSGRARRRSRRERSG